MTSRDVRPSWESAETRLSRAIQRRQFRAAHRRMCTDARDRLYAAHPPVGEQVQLSRSVGSLLSEAERDRQARENLKTLIKNFGEAVRNTPPDPNRSEAEARRYYSTDLADMPDRTLWREAEQSRLLATFFDEGTPAQEWAWDRLGYCERELKRRERAQGGA